MDFSKFLQSWDKVKVVLEESRNWNTRQKILADWSADFDKPTLATLGRWLTRAAALGLVLQQGTGSKSQPFRYALPGKEEEWMKDPMYELNKKFEESDRLVRETLGGSWPLRGERR